MDILIKNVKEKHLVLIHELAKSLDYEVGELKETSPYDPDFIAKIKQGDEDIESGRTTKVTLDEIWK